MEVNGLQVLEGRIHVGEDLASVGQGRRRATGEQRHDGEKAGGRDGERLPTRHLNPPSEIPTDDCRAS
jgi:hypothetical protein